MGTKLDLNLRARYIWIKVLRKVKKLTAFDILQNVLEVVYCYTLIAWQVRLHITTEHQSQGSLGYLPYKVVDFFFRLHLTCKMSNIDFNGLLVGHFMVEHLLVMLHLGRVWFKLLFNSNSFNFV